MFKLETVYMVRIIYTSGAVQDFEATEFSIEDGSASWKAVSKTMRPMLLGVDHIASVWQIGQRKRIARKD